VLTTRSSVPVEDLAFSNADKADLNKDGVVDTHDIRAFARQHGLELQPEFARKLAKLEKRQARSLREKQGR
jgi:hypothetical protein